jgi:hypothetical protein
MSARTDYIATHTQRELPLADCTGCTTCGSPEGCGPPAEDGPFRGWHLVLISAGLFLGPVGLAIVGAILGGDRPAAQLLGAVTGLLLGMGAGILAAKLLGSNGEKD